MSKIISVNERFIKDQLGEMVRGTVEEALNTMLDNEAAQLCNAKRYEHTETPLPDTMSVSLIPGLVELT